MTFMNSVINSLLSIISFFLAKTKNQNIFDFLQTFVINIFFLCMYQLACQLKSFESEVLCKLTLSQ